MSLESLTWQKKFIDGTPGDPKIGGLPRQVPGACWSRVDPTPTPNPELRLWSREMADDLGVDRSDVDILGGAWYCGELTPTPRRSGRVYN